MAPGIALSPDARREVESALADWLRDDNTRRLWDSDASLWTSHGEERWLGWLRVLEGWRERVPDLERWAADVRDVGFRHVVVLGMGGSSLCPEVIARTFGTRPGWPELRVLDSTVPDQIRGLRLALDPGRTLFVVASKSGTTIEPNAFASYFEAEVRAEIGAAGAGSHFIAITDPGSSLDERASGHYRDVIHGVPSIGGRFSALSPFGLVPAALAGVDLRELLERAEKMVEACKPEVPIEQNPGVTLGLVLGTLALRGRDKLTLVASPPLTSLGIWLEQLIAESTGKHGRGIVPIDGERLGPVGVYGDDRLFVDLSTATDPPDSRLAQLEAAGHPVVRIPLEGTLDIAAEFFRWEVATAVAASVLGVNPFDQPDVEAAKLAARALMATHSEGGSLPERAALLRQDGITLFADAANADALAPTGDLESVLAAHLGRLDPGDYLALNAFIARNDRSHAALQTLRHCVRDARGVATTLGYGPRFQHSTGQLHKGGPNRGVFLQITADPEDDLEIPDQAFSFGVLATAQSLGDFDVLAERGRRLLRVHLGTDVAGGLARLADAVERALGE